MELGTLLIRNDGRHPKNFSVLTTVTERTNYKVAVDVNNDSMLLWIPAPSSQLQARSLPMFNGILENEDCVMIVFASSLQYLAQAAVTPNQIIKSMPFSSPTTGLEANWLEGLPQKLDE
jgi:hypothetical protein